MLKGSLGRVGLAACPLRPLPLVQLLAQRVQAAVVAGGYGVNQRGKINWARSRSQQPPQRRPHPVFPIDRQPGPLRPANPTPPEGVHLTFKNGNPHNIYMMGLKGVHRPQLTKTYYRTLRFSSGRHSHSHAWVTDASDNEAIVTASTYERPWSKRLFSSSNKSAAKLLGIIMAQRLREAGIDRVHWYDGVVRQKYENEKGPKRVFYMHHYKSNHGKPHEFLQSIKAAGIIINDRKT